VKRLAEQPRKSSFSAKDLVDLYGLPQEALAKILQRLARAGLLLSHHGIKGGYSLARDPQQISVLDVIKASEGATRDGIHGKHWRDLESLPGYHQLRMASQIVEDALHRVTIADLKEQASSPTESYDARRCRSSRGDLQFTGILRILHAIPSTQVLGTQNRGLPQMLCSEL
jgi:Rrf2 family protein